MTDEFIIISYNLHEYTALKSVMIVKFIYIYLRELISRSVAIISSFEHVVHSTRGNNVV